MENNTKLLLTICFFIIFSGLGLLFFKSSAPAEVIPTANPAQEASASGEIIGERVKVIEVVDGDTIKLNTGQTVRFIGIDTPETKDPRRPVGCFGKEASAETKNLLDGREVILKKDVSDVDKYNRILRYVYLPLPNGQTLFVNDYLIRAGFAKVSTYPPDVKYTEQFIEAERQAREGNKGLWGRCLRDSPSNT